ncbi:MAG TPA: nucleotide pyrophosphatase/phosphodiesterase family protein [Chloroflexota bacterium]|nr:nucleotide pyrophosphatase/phosphodiesterase family protein [Chloroflexota bacterium]
MRKTVVLDVVGLTPGLLGDATPRLRAFAERGRVASITPVLPAVTCTAQATYLTGAHPEAHGIVGNGWYFRDECEVRFWRQSNKLVQQPKIWERARSLEPSFTCANLFWWFNMYSSADYSVTPRPMYPADGRKLPDVYTQPAELRPGLQAALGQFPLFNFWGPATSIRASRWIADAALWVDRQHDPTLTLIYLPHLDYCLQRLGPGHPEVAADLRQIDAVCGDLIDHYQARDCQIIVLSEYGIGPVSRAVHLNRRLRESGLLAVRDELGRELLDPGASAAFAVADHQVAHVYVNDPDRLSQARAVLEDTAGVALVLDAGARRAHHLDHPRCGELVAVAEPDAWFTYYYWLDDNRAPDFARTVDIHRKPGYDPVELFVDPSLRFPKLKVGSTLLQQRLGFRTLLDVVPLDASLVRGSHGRVPDEAAEMPIFVTQSTDLLDESDIQATDVCELILRHLTADRSVPSHSEHSERGSG